MEGFINFLRRIKMKKKMVFGMVLVLLIQGSFLYADASDDFIGYAHQRNWNRMERVLNSNKNRFTNTEKERISSMISINFRGDEAIRGFDLLKKYNINPNPDSLFWAFNYSQPDNVIEYLWVISGIEKGISEVRLAIQKRRFNYVQRLLSTGNIDNLDWRVTRAIYRDRGGKDADYRVDIGWTALMWAVQMEHPDTARRLVELGANVNLRDENGATAASMAYDNGLMDLYNYLKANGAVDFEPRQVTQQPAAPAQSTTNVYVQPSAPAQPAPAPAPSTPAAPRLSPGFYSDRSVSGSQINLTMVYSNATNASGMALHSINRLNSSQGTLTISGTQLVISWYSGPLSGVRSVYRIDSSSQFSGSGETWRAGL
jgi:hypothetical protein